MSGPPSSSGGGVETLAQAIERVWSRRRGWPDRKEQGGASRDRGNWASLWVCALDVAQPVATRGSGEETGGGKEERNLLFASPSFRPPHLGPLTHTHTHIHIHEKSTTTTTQTSSSASP
jgi:hypothetical protein